MKITHIQISAIKVQSRELARNDKDINLAKKSIEDRGLINPITVDEKNNLITGYIRLCAAKKLKWETIPCIIIEGKDDMDKKLIEIDENLINKDLSRLEKAQLLSQRKKIYELKYPNSTKAYKSAQNAKKEEDKEETELSFNDYMSEHMGCSSKTVQNLTSQYDSISGTNPELARELINYEKKAKRNLKGIEIADISKMTPNEMEKLLNELIYKGELKERFSIGDLLLGFKKESKLSQREKLEQIFKYDLLEILSNIPNLKHLSKNIKIDKKEVRELKLNEKISFKNQITFILELLKVNNDEMSA